MGLHKPLKFALLIAGVFLAFSAFDTAFAAAAPAAQAGHGGGKSLWDLFNAAAPVSYLLALVFTIGLALTLEHIFSIKMDKLAPPDLVADLEALVDDEQYEEALELCHSSDAYIARVMGGALIVREAGYEEMLHEMESVANSETFNLNTKISYLSLIGNIGPLIGLLGTVTGMISSFQIIETTKNPTPADLAVGIYEALVNTTMGLFIGIVYLAAFFFFKNKVSSMTLEMNLRVAELVKRMGLETERVS